MGRRKTALVLSGGGSRGAYQCGVWQALVELGIKIDIVVGVSVGALNGSMVVEGDVIKTANLWRDIETDMVFDVEADAGLPELVTEILLNGGAGTSGLQDLIARYVDEITCSCLREQSVLAVEEIEALFRRCDYVRFARGSVESRRLPEAMYAACLMNGERKVLVEKALKAIMAIESDKDDKVGKSMKDESADKDRKKPSLFLFFKKKVHDEEPENQ